MATTYSVDGKSFGSIGEAENYLSGRGYDKYTIEDKRKGGIGRQTGVGMGEGAGLLGGAGGGGGGLFGGGRLFGGPAPKTGLFAPGAMFGASASPAAAATGKTFMGYGYTDPKTGQWVSPGMDMRDGGGKGRSGDTFEGGPFSGLLNALGVRPAGYRQRLEDNLAPQTSLRPQMRPAGLLGGTAGTQSAVDRALAAASVGDKSAAPATGPENSLMTRAYYNRLLQTGIAPEGLTPVGQPMTRDEQLLMPKYMSDDRSPAAFAQSRMEAAERARYARAGAPIVVPLPTAAPVAQDGFTRYMAGQGYDQDFVNALDYFPSQRSRFMQQYSRSIPGISSGGLLGSGMSMIPTFE